jgi:hypothetical protein
LTQAESKALLRLLVEAYPSADLRPGTLRIYADLLSDLPYEAAVAALRRLLLTRPYSSPPTIGEIRHAAVELMAPRLPTPDEAWGQVSRANKLYGYMRPREALASLHPLVRRVAEAIGWRTIVESEQPDVIRAHFTRLYQSALERARLEAVLPEDLRDGALAGAGTAQLPGGEAS